MGRRTPADVAGRLPQIVYIDDENGDVYVEYKTTVDIAFIRLTLQLLPPDEITDVKVNKIYDKTRSEFTSDLRITGAYAGRLYKSGVFQSPLLSIVEPMIMWQVGQRADTKRFAPTVTWEDKNFIAPFFSPGEGLLVKLQTNLNNMVPTLAKRPLQRDEGRRPGIKGRGTLIQGTLRVWPYILDWKGNPVFPN